jgi:hypothetical protein
MPAEQVRVAQRRIRALRLVPRDEVEEGEPARSRVEALGQTDGLELAV